MSTPWLIAVYCAIVALCSLAGGWLPTIIRMTHLRTQLLMSFVAGLMLGIATLHLLPHAVELTQSSRGACATMLGGTLLMFLMLRTFHVHHDASEQGGLHEHIHEHQHEHALPIACAHPAHSHPSDQHHHSLGWLGLLVGLGLHTLMDGFALGSSVAADAAHHPWLGLAGLGTFLAVALHKPLDAFAILSVMRHSNIAPKYRLWVNFVFAVSVPMGAFAAWLGAAEMGFHPRYLGYGLAFSAGFFICIALADLLPEVHFHDHDRGKLTAALLIGLTLALVLENLPGHSHTPPPPASASELLP